VTGGLVFLKNGCNVMWTPGSWLCWVASGDNIS